MDSNFLYRLYPYDIGSSTDLQALLFFFLPALLSIKVIISH